MENNTNINSLNLEKFLSEYINNLDESKKIKNTLLNEILLRIKNNGDRIKWIKAKDANKNWSDTNRKFYIDILKTINEYDKSLINVLELSATKLSNLSKNTLYTRKEISIFANNYNEQRGILVEKPIHDNLNDFKPNVFAILNLGDHENKYNDYISEDTIYYYPLDSGVQYPMNDSANIAIKNILGDNTSGIYMFQKTKKDGYKFLGKYYMHSLGNDDNNNLIFILKPFVKLRSQKEIVTSLVSVWNSEDKWINKNKIFDKEDLYVLTKNRANQGYYREILLQKYNSSCALTGIQNKELLIASHIKPYAKCNQNEKIDENNGLLLSALADKLFDRGLISFNNNGDIIFSNLIENSDLQKIKKHLINTNIKNIYFSSKKYFEFHYEKVFK